MSTDVVSPLRQRMIEDMNGAQARAGHAEEPPCPQPASGLRPGCKRSPDTATALTTSVGIPAAPCPRPA